MSQIADPPRRPPHRERHRPRFSGVLGEILLTLGVVLLLFTFYEAFWTNLASGRLQEKADARLEETWQAEDPGEAERVNPRQRLTPELGEAFARMYIPAFGSDYRFAILEGTDEADLMAGPGRYTESQLPGEEGNFAVAGHRVGKGSPFNDLGNLEPCDAIVVETATEWVTYRVLPVATAPGQRRSAAAACLDEAQVDRVADGDYAHVRGRHITVPGDIAVINPVPGAGTTTDTEELEGLITLTTCHPQFSNAERMIVHAMAVDASPKNPGEFPAVLEES